MGCAYEAQTTPVRCGCGGEAESDFYIGESHFVYCKKCKITTAMYDTEAEAVKAWNRAMGGLLPEENSQKNVDCECTTNTERKKGEWIKEDLSGYLTPGGNSIYHCSECDHTEGPWPWPRLTNYCPNCGADMRGDHE